MGKPNEAGTRSKDDNRQFVARGTHKSSVYWWQRSLDGDDDDNITKIISKCKGMRFTARSTDSNFIINRLSQCCLTPFFMHVCSCFCFKIIEFFCSLLHHLKIMRNIGMNIFSLHLSEESRQLFFAGSLFHVENWIPTYSIDRLNSKWCDSVNSFRNFCLELLDTLGWASTPISMCVSDSDAYNLRANRIELCRSLCAILSGKLITI